MDATHNNSPISGPDPSAQNPSVPKQIKCDTNANTINDLFQQRVDKEVKVAKTTLTAAKTFLDKENKNSEEIQHETNVTNLTTTVQTKIQQTEAARGDFDTIQKEVEAAKHSEKKNKVFTITSLVVGVACIVAGAALMIFPPAGLLVFAIGGGILIAGLSFMTLQSGRTAAVEAADNKLTNAKNTLDTNLKELEESRKKLDDVLIKLPNSAQTFQGQTLSTEEIEKKDFLNILNDNDTTSVPFDKTDREIARVKSAVQRGTIPAHEGDIEINRANLKKLDEIEQNISTIKQILQENIPPQQKTQLQQSLKELQAEKNKFIHSQLDDANQRIQAKQQEIDELKQEIELFPQSLDREKLLQPKQKTLKNLEFSLENDHMFIAALESKHPQRIVYAAVMSTNEALKNFTTTLIEEVNDYRFSREKEVSLKQSLADANPDDRRSILDQIEEEKRNQGVQRALIEPMLNDIKILKSQLAVEPEDISPELKVQIDNLSKLIESTQRQSKTILSQMIQNEILDRLEENAEIDKEIDLLTQKTERLKTFLAEPQSSPQAKEEANREIEELNENIKQLETQKNNNEANNIHLKQRFNEINLIQQESSSKISSTANEPKAQVEEVEVDDNKLNFNQIYAENEILRLKDKIKTNKKNIEKLKEEITQKDSSLTKQEKNAKQIELKKIVAENKALESEIILYEKVLE